MKIGNPLVATAANNPLVINKISKGIGIMGIIIGGATAIGIGGYLFSKNRKEKILREVNLNPNYRAAVSIYSVIPDKYKKAKFINIKNTISKILPDFVERWTNYQQLDKNALMLIASQTITNYPEVAKAFKILFKEDLTQLLGKILSTNELNTFMTSANSHKGNSVNIQSKNQNKRGYRILTTRETQCYMFYTDKNPFRLSIVVKLSQNIPANVSTGIYQGGIVNNILPNNTTEFVVTKFAETSTEILYLLTPSNSAKFVSSSVTNYKKLTINKSGKVIKIT
jgi:hypothetical protein